MQLITRSPAARADLLNHYVYLAEEAGETVAERFWQNVEQSLELLADQPYIGAAIKLKHPALASLRKWAVKDFDRFLIFYTLRPTGVHIVRVLNGSQDWWGLLGLAE